MYKRQDQDPLGLDQLRPRGATGQHGFGQCQLAAAVAADEGRRQAHRAGPVTSPAAALDLADDLPMPAVPGAMPVTEVNKPK